MGPVIIILKVYEVLVTIGNISALIITHLLGYIGIDTLHSRLSFSFIHNNISYPFQVKVSGLRRACVRALKICYLLKVIIYYVIDKVNYPFLTVIINTIMPGIKEPVFRDIPYTFIPHPVTGNVTILENADAVKSSIKNLILTNFHERLFNSGFGGDLVSQLFENFDSLTEHMVRKKIITAIENYEPRADLISVDIGQNEQELGQMDVTIKFRVVNSIEPVELKVILERVR